jgi:hypothetical protein
MKINYASCKKLISQISITWRVNKSAKPQVWNMKFLPDSILPEQQRFLRVLYRQDEFKFNDPVLGKNRLEDVHSYLNSMSVKKN